MTCPKCGNQMQIQAVSEVKRRGIFTVLLYLILICIPVIGWIILISLLRGQKSQVKMLAVCQACGYQTEYKESQSYSGNAQEKSAYSNGAAYAGQMGAYSAAGVSQPVFIISLLSALAVSFAGLFVLLKYSWWGLAIVGVGLVIFTILYNKA